MITLHMLTNFTNISESSGRVLPTTYSKGEDNIVSVSTDGINEC